jgi:hypothetical protein
MIESLLPGNFSSKRGNSNLALRIVVRLHSEESKADSFNWNLSEPLLTIRFPFLVPVLL